MNVIDDAGIYRAVVVNFVSVCVLVSFLLNTAYFIDKIGEKIETGGGYMACFCHDGIDGLTHLFGVDQLIGKYRQIPFFLQRSFVFVLLNVRIDKGKVRESAVFFKEIRKPLKLPLDGEEPPASKGSFITTLINRRRERRIILVKGNGDM